MLDSLQKEIAASVARDREKEVGGLLFGIEERGLHEGGDTGLHVHLSHPVPCNYTSGPLYRLSRSDKAGLVTDIPESLQYSRWEIVGFYRTSRRSAIELDNQDREFADHVLPMPASIVLLIDLLAHEGPTGSLLVREESGVFGKAIVQFALNRHQGAGDQTKALADPGIVAPASADGAAQYARVTKAISEAKVPGSSLHRTDLSRPSLWGIGILLAGLVCFVLIKFPIRTAQNNLQPSGHVALPKVTGELGLKASMEDDYIRVKWDPNLISKSAKTGVIAIKDGLFRNMVPLDEDLLRKGTITYFPLTASVDLELQVGGLADFATVSTIPKTMTPDQQAIVPSVNQPAPAVRPVISKAMPKTLPVRSPNEHRASENERQIDPETRQVTEVLPPPAIQLESRVLPSLLPQLPVPALPGKSGLLETREGATHIAPRSLQRVAPKASPEVRRLLIEPTTIRVKVSIDANGNVTKTESLTRGNPLLNHLSALSEDAARKWVFRAAQEGNRPVVSETVLEFYFEPRE